MKCDKEMMLLYAVTDRNWTSNQSLYEQVEAALKGGVTCIQLREKELNDEDFLKEAKDIGLLCKAYQVPFIINDHVEIALKSQAQGIHVGQDDMEVSKVREIVGEDMIIGVSVHNVQEALKAQSEGADYLGVGAMFHTSTKTDASVLSLDMLKAITSAVHIPVVAIGGINKDNISLLSNTNIDGVAVVSAIFGAKDIEKATRELYQLSKEMVTA